MALANKAYYFVTDDGGQPMLLGDVHQDANGWFPSPETATAAAEAASGQEPGRTFYVVLGSRTLVSTVSSQVTTTVV